MFNFMFYSLARAVSVAGKSSNPRVVAIPAADNDASPTKESPVKHASTKVVEPASKRSPSLRIVNKRKAETLEEGLAQEMALDVDTSLDKSLEEAGKVEKKPAKRGRKPKAK